MKLTNKLLALGLMTSAFALQSANAANPFSGVYVGATAGMSSMNANAKNDTTQDATAANATMNWKGKKKTTFQGNLLVGKEVYRINNDMPVAVEFTFGTTTGAEKRKEAQQVAGALDPRLTKVRQTWKLGLSAVVGHKITNKMTVSGKLGVVYSNFRVDQLINDSGFTGAFDGLNRKFGKDMRLWGVEPGVRLSYDINDCMCTFVEGTYTLFQSKKQTFINQGTAPNTEHFTTKISPRVFGLVAGFTYKM
ncbi:MAG: outer membrane beta-barrel protein [Holosporaceae bacterium]|nr:MAG: outer membrane beta-barrel protein [Holosporaceae bacterium]